MMKRFFPVALLLFALAALSAPAEDKKDDGFVPMFNGKDLTGWVNADCAPSTFYVKDNQIITTGKPTGYLRTAKQYENFIADFEWMHIPPTPGAVGNSGFFVWADPIPAIGTGYARGIEVQVLVNLEYKDKKTGAITATSHGDLFSIHGATCVPERPHPLGWARCLPSENRAKGEREWNHYRVEANDGTIQLAVNGKVVSKVSKCSPRKGYLALEAEGSECRFRNLKIKELPSTNPKKEDIADEAQGHVPLFTGLDLSGWKVDDEAKNHWTAKDRVLHYDGKGKELRTEKEYGDAEFIVDFRFPKQGDKRCAFVLREGKEGEVKVMVSPDGIVGASAPSEAAKSKTPAFKPGGGWNRLTLSLKDGTLRVAINKGSPVEMPARGVSARSAFTLRPEGAMDLSNLFVRGIQQ
jgi:hypothetical protein